MTGEEFGTLAGKFDRSGKRNRAGHRTRALLIGSSAIRTSASCWS